MEEIVKEDIRKYISDTVSELNYKYKSHKQLYQILHCMFEAAVEDGTIERSPMLELKSPRKPKAEDTGEQNKSYNEDEVAYIMKCLDKEPFKWKALIIFMLDSGCRRGEVAGLKWKNVNLQTGEVKVSENRQYSSRLGLYDTTPKSSKPRTIFITSYALKILNEWYEIQAHNDNVPLSEYCFPNDIGNGIDPHTINKYFEKFGKKYKIRNFHPHILRHTMATISIANGADIVSISKKLGHFSPALTLDVYSHANEEALELSRNVQSKNTQNLR